MAPAEEPGGSRCGWAWVLAGLLSVAALVASVVLSGVGSLRYAASCASLAAVVAWGAFALLWIWRGPE